MKYEKRRDDHQDDGRVLLFEEGANANGEGHHGGRFGQYYVCRLLSNITSRVGVGVVAAGGGVPMCYSTDIGEAVPIHHWTTAQNNYILCKFKSVRFLNT